jgi:MOSC domain-containing protein YiiM
MRAERLTVSPVKGERSVTGKLTLDALSGVHRDVRSRKDGSVSLLSAEAEREIREAGGLCTDRFAANIVTRGLDYACLRKGARLRAGGCVLEILRVGKSCFETCPLAKRANACPLQKNCAFARVVTGGELNADDEIVFI